MRRSIVWLDLPQDIVVLVINKLHLRDQIRTLAVCKSWRVCKDYVRSLGNLPWVARHVHVNPIDKYRLKYELFDPNSLELYEVSYKITLNPCCWNAFPLASKQGWLLFGSHECSSIFLHNPFTNDIRVFSNCLENHTTYSRALINGHPTSPECEVFMFAMSADYLRIDTYKPSGKSEIFVPKVRNCLYKMVYMKRNIYCLFVRGELYCYGLEDQSWKLLTSRFPEPSNASCHYWLLEIKENLIMVVADIVDEVYKWIIFRFDWSGMSWVVETGLKGCAIYIRGGESFARPLTDCRAKKIEECKVFNLQLRGRGLRCYSLSKAMRTEIIYGEYDWIRGFQECSFIECPTFGN